MKPEKMTDDEIAKVCYPAKLDAREIRIARTIEAAVNAKWEALIPKLIEAYGGDLANVPAQKEQP